MASISIFSCVCLVNQIVSVEEGGGRVRSELERLEQEVYKWQLKVYNIQMEILQEEEKQIKNKLKYIQMQQKGKPYSTPAFYSQSSKDKWIKIISLITANFNSLLQVYDQTSLVIYLPVSIAHLK